MSKRALSRLRSTPVLRRRSVLLGAGLGLSLAMAAGVALGAEASRDSILSAQAPSAAGGDLVRAQALTQQRAADAEKRAARDAAAKRVELKKEAAKLSASWMTPVGSYEIGSHFGLPGSHWAHKHSGQDFVVPTGTSVRAAHGGTVVKAGGNGAGDGPAYGNAIVIRHSDHTYSQYAHLSKVEVRPGEEVRTGQPIARSGSTGNSTGPHLHFEIRTGPAYGTGIEPLAFLRGHDVDY